MNIYYLAGKLHTDQTIKYARPHHQEPEQRVVINGESRDAIGVVMEYRHHAGYLSGRKGYPAQVSTTLPPRIYTTVVHARSAIAATGVYGPGSFNVQYVHTVKS